MITNSLCFYPLFYVADKTLTLSALYILKWKNDQGYTQEFRLVDKVSDQWENMGRLLEIDNHELERFRIEFQGNPSWCWNGVIGLWLNWSTAYPPIWDSLYEVLEGIGCSKTAMELKEAVNKAFSHGKLFVMNVFWGYNLYTYITVTKITG